MKTKPFKFTLLILAVSVAVALVFFISSNNQRSEFLDQNTILYCAIDGKLLHTKATQSHNSYCVKSGAHSVTYVSNTPAEYSFLIIDNDGNTLKDFTITHTKLMHMIVVRKDLNYFQHVHPSFDKMSGTFTLKDLTFPADGEYRIFADFASENAPTDAAGKPLATTISEDITVGKEYTPQPLGSEEKTKLFDDYEVVFSPEQSLVAGEEVKLMFDIRQHNTSITDLEEYLGALGHTVILQEGKLNFIHAHPIENTTIQQSGRVSFAVNFPEAGKYKVFSQFQRKGTIITTDFVVSVAEGEAETSNSIPSHSMH